MSDRLSDEDVADIIFDGSTMAFQEEIHLLAREVQEWRAKAAADTVQDNPYKFWVEVRSTWTDDRPYLVWLMDGRGGGYAVRRCSEAEAREHARLIVAALRNVEVEQ